MTEPAARISSSHTIYIAYKLAYKPFLVVQVMAVYLCQTRQYRVIVLVPLEFDFQNFFIFLRLVVVLGIP